MSGSTFEGAVERMYVAGVRGSPLALMSSTREPGESTPQVEAQAVVGYTAYGRVREAGDWGQLVASPSTLGSGVAGMHGTHAGYTGGRDEETLGVVVLGARVYVPALGRWLSPDPAGVGNPYAYADDDPVNDIDPTGAFSLGDALVLIAVIVVSYFTDGALSESGASALEASMGAGAAGAIGTDAQDGVFQGEGSGWAALGTISVLAGGQFGAGFLGAFSSAMVAYGYPLEGEVDTGSEVAHVVLSAVVGGTVSALAGESFANGTLSAAFQEMFNEEAHAGQAKQQLRRIPIGKAPASSQDLLAHLMFAESAGVPAAYPAIGYSIVNRVGAPGFPSSLTAVIFEPNQYASVGGKLWNAAANPSQLTGANAASYAQARRIATGILNGTIPDPVPGATYFYSGSPSHWFQEEVNSGVLTPVSYSVRPFTFLRQY